MLIWSGHGILIPLFGIAGAIVGGLIGATLGAAFAPDNPQISSGLAMIAGAWCSVLATLLYAKTIGKTVVTELLDPKTRRPVLIKKSHSFFFIPAVAWPFISGALALMTTFGGVVAMTSSPSEYGGMSSALSAAESNIMTDRNGVAYGNCSEAIELAREFGSELKAIREMTISESKSSGLSLSGGEFLTHCELSDAGVAFLVHVPKLRKFTDDAKDVLAMGAEYAAGNLARRLSPKPERVAVGIRGSLLYDRIIVGGVPAEESVELADSVTHDGSDKEVLNPFFEGVPATVTYQLEAGDVESPATAVAHVETASAPEPPEEPSTPAPSVASESPQPDPEPKKEVSEAPASGANMPAEPKMAAAIALPTEPRDWKSSDGRPLKAALVRFVDSEGTSAEFRREDGELFTIGVDRFSEEDQDFLRQAHQSQGP